MVGIVAMAACSSDPQTKAADTSAAWTDPSPHDSGFVSGNGARLQYLDWGGTGPYLVLIHGFGDSPHVFDALAPALSDRFQVIAYARRAHGLSSKDGPFDNATLVADLRTVLDSLRIPRASLLGWSMGGNEITEFAGQYPDRIDKLVYLEAAYQWSDSVFQQGMAAAPITFAPDSSSLRSLDAFRTWYRRTWFPDVEWTDALEANLRGIVHINADGSVEPLPPQSAMTGLFESLQTTRRDYSKVRAPVLALYSTSFFGANPADSALNQKLQAWEAQVMSTWRQASIDRIKRELNNPRIVMVPNTSHTSIAVRDTREVAEVIKGFFDGPP
jgi:pimeloyl-ACP methyl ester carboxylesterase